MTSDWRQRVAELYRVFSRYRLPKKIDGCPCCVRDEEAQPLHRKALADLDEEDLGRYSSKAMTTWGGVDEYRYLLPRLFELSLTTHVSHHGLEAWVIGGKLAYARFSTWPEPERRAVLDLLDALAQAADEALVWSPDDVAQARAELAKER